MKENDKFIITPKVTGTMKVKTNMGKTIPFILLNCNLLLNLQITPKAIGLLAIAESIGRSFSALDLSHKWREPIEAILETLVELQMAACIEPLHSKKRYIERSMEESQDKKNAVTVRDTVTAKTNYTHTKDYTYDI